MRVDTSWLGCDGRGHLSRNQEPDRPHSRSNDSGDSPTASSEPKLDRRRVLWGIGLGAVTWITRGATALADLGVRPGAAGHDQPLLVSIFLRGGADGLNIVVPYGDDGYGRNRPTIGLAAPNDRRVPAASRVLPLDGFFGFHPALAPLLPFYQEGQLAIVHAVGSDDHTRSHFESMAAIEHGEANGQEGAASGWLGRYLAATASPGDSPVRAVSFSNELPDSLRGGPSPIALTSLTDFRLRPPFGGNPAATAELHAQLAQIYAPGNDLVQSAGRDTLAVLDALNRLDPAHYKPRTGTVYPAGELATGLRQVACLTKANLGLEVACLDHRGPYLWDTHVAQGAVFAAQVRDLGMALAAFAQDLGPLMRRTTIVVMTEFGRRLQENSGLGTDHGRASVMFVMGGRVQGGRVYGKWPGLADDQLEPPGDLRVTTDYREVLAEALIQGVGFDGGGGRMGVVFPGFEAGRLGVMRG